MHAVSGTPINFPYFLVSGHVSIELISSNWINSNHDIKFTNGVTGFLIPPFQGTFTMIRNGTVYSLMNEIFRGCNTVFRFFQAPSDTDGTDETVKNFMAYFTKAVQLPFY